jgi:hypothetical protein
MILQYFEGGEEPLLKLLAVMVAGRRFQSYCVTYLLFLGESPACGSRAAVD